MLHSTDLDVGSADVELRTGREVLQLQGVLPASLGQGQAPHSQTACQRPLVWIRRDNEGFVDLHEIWHGLRQIG